MPETIIESTPRMHEMSSTPATIHFIAQLYKIYHEELNTVAHAINAMRHNEWVGGVGTYDIEGELYYMFCRHGAVRSGADIGCASGYSSYYAACAIVRNGGHLHCFDIKPHAVCNARINLRRFGDHISFYEGDCRDHLRRMSPDVRFQYVLSDAHAADYHNTFLQEVLPRTDGVVFVHDLIPKHRPRNDPETVYFQWLLGVSGVNYISMASLLFSDVIQSARKNLIPRYPSNDQNMAKGIMFLYPSFNSENLFRHKTFTSRMHPPKGMDYYCDDLDMVNDVYISRKKNTLSFERPHNQGAVIQFKKYQSLKDRIRAVMSRRSQRDCHPQKILMLATSRQAHIRRVARMLRSRHALTRLDCLVRDGQQIGAFESHLFDDVITYRGYDANGMISKHCPDRPVIQQCRQRKYDKVVVPVHSEDGAGYDHVRWLAQHIKRKPWMINTRLRDV